MAPALLSFSFTRSCSSNVPCFFSYWSSCNVPFCSYVIFLLALLTSTVLFLSFSFRLSTISHKSWLSFLSTNTSLASMEEGSFGSGSSTPIAESRQSKSEFKSLVGCCLVGGILLFCFGRAGGSTMFPLASRIVIPELCCLLTGTGTGGLLGAAGPSCYYFCWDDDGTFAPYYIPCF